MSARLLLIVSCILVVFGGSCVAKHEAMRPNFLLITVDDMNWDSVGAYRVAVHGATPNIDRLATEGVRLRGSRRDRHLEHPAQRLLLAVGGVLLVVSCDDLGRQVVRML